MDGRHLQPSFAHADAELPVFLFFADNASVFFKNYLFEYSFFSCAAGFRVGTDIPFLLCTVKRKEKKSHWAKNNNCQNRVLAELLKLFLFFSLYEFVCTLKKAAIFCA